MKTYYENYIFRSYFLFIAISRKILQFLKGIVSLYIIRDIYKWSLTWIIGRWALTSLYVGVYNPRNITSLSFNVFLDGYLYYLLFFSACYSRHSYTCKMHSPSRLKSDNRMLCFSIYCWHFLVRRLGFCATSKSFLFQFLPLSVNGAIYFFCLFPNCFIYLTLIFTCAFHVGALLLSY